VKKRRFFRLLHLGRIFKEAGDSYIERWRKLFWVRSAYSEGWFDGSMYEGR